VLGFSGVAAMRRRGLLLFGDSQLPSSLGQIFDRGRIALRALAHHLSASLLLSACS
jgi:hypothetical protein